MRKFTKGICGLGGTLLSFGLIMLVVGFFMGGRPQGLSIGWNNGPVLRRHQVTAGDGSTVTVPPVGADKIRSLELSIGAADVEIRTGSEFSLDVTGTVPYTSTVENGVWLLSNNSESLTLRNGKAPRYVVTIPANFSFESVSMEIGAGTLEATGLHASDAYVSVGAGTMRLYDFIVNGDTNIDVGMGTLVMNGALNGYNYLDCGMGTAKLLVETPADYGYKVSCGMGTVKVNESGTGGIGGEMTLNAGAATFYEIDCGMGTVKVEFSGSAATTNPASTETPAKPGTGRETATETATEKAA